MCFTFGQMRFRIENKYDHQNVFRSKVRCIVLLLTSNERGTLDAS